MTLSSQLEEFVKYVTPMGKSRLEFLLYAMRSYDSPTIEGPNISIWPPGTETQYFLLYDDESWPVAIDMFEIYTPQLPYNHIELLSLALSDVIKQGSKLSWYMFDATFGGIGYNMFFSWEIEGTYGVCWPEQPPRLALLSGEREDPAWASLLIKGGTCARKSYPDRWPKSDDELHR